MTVVDGEFRVENGETYRVAVRSVLRDSDGDRISSSNWLPTVPAAVIPDTNTNADLRSLALSGATISPAFAETTTKYTATVGSTVTETTVTAIPASADVDTRLTISVGGVPSARTAW